MTSQTESFFYAPQPEVDGGPVVFSDDLSGGALKWAVRQAFRLDADTPNAYRQLTDAQRLQIQTGAHEHKFTLLHCLMEVHESPCELPYVALIQRADDQGLPIRHGYARAMGESQAQAADRAYVKHVFGDRMTLPRGMQNQF